VPLEDGVEPGEAVQQVIQSCLQYTNTTYLVLTNSSKKHHVEERTCCGSGSASFWESGSGSNKNQDPDPHQIKIRNYVNLEYFRFAAFPKVYFFVTFILTPVNKFEISIKLCVF
jgi:hypothetical protein